MNISIVGTGYVGLVTGTCLASEGHRVTCVDTRPEVVEKINRGVALIYECGLDELLAKVLASGRLSVTTDCRKAVLDTDVTLICVGTPTGTSGMDLSQVISASVDIGSTLAEKNTYHVVAVKSTVLPGTTEGIVKSTLEKYSGRRLGDGWGLCMNPEFLREGRAVEDFLTPDRIVIGASDEEAGKLLLKVYDHVDCPKVVTTLRTAEMIKYVSNSLFATLISFSNEIANLCAAIRGIDAREVWRGVHLDRRLTPLAKEDSHPAGVIEYLWHGLGFGGSCFPKDVAALRHLGKSLGEPTPILDSVIAINVVQPLQIIALLEREMDMAGKRVAVLGLAFKPGTSDIRESPALRVVAGLRQRGAHIILHDPVAMTSAQREALYEGASFAQGWQEALEGADACCIITSWPEYRAITPDLFKKLMRRPLVIDGRGLFDPETFAEAGVAWRGIGHTPENRKTLELPRTEGLINAPGA